jgi:hypothetical protein
MRLVLKVAFRLALVAGGVLAAATPVNAEEPQHAAVTLACKNPAASISAHLTQQEIDMSVASWVSTNLLDAHVEQKLATYQLGNGLFRVVPVYLDWR